MPKEKIAYVCSNCGQEAAKWIGRCPSCGQWNTYREVRIGTSVKHTAAFTASSNISGRGKIQKLSGITSLHKFF